MDLERRGGLCTLGKLDGLRTAIAEANRALKNNSLATEITQSLDIPWIPPTLNEILAMGKGKAGKWRLSLVKREWTNKLSGFISQSGVRAYQPKEAIWIEFVWFVSFDRDFDNLAASAKFILDALRDAKIIRSDNLTIFQSPVEHWHERSPNDEGEHVIMTLSNTPRHNLERHRRYLSMISDELDRF